MLLQGGILVKDNLNLGSSARYVVMYGGGTLVRNVIGMKGDNLARFERYGPLMW